VKAILGVSVLFSTAFLLTGAHAASTADANYEVVVDSALTVGVSANSVVLNVAPGSHPFDHGDLDVYVTTNHITGYTLSTLADSTTLVEKNDPAATMPTLASGSYTESTFTANKWGYQVGTTGNYGPFVSGTKIANSSGPVSNDTTTLRFAAKVDATQPAGAYSTQLSFAVTANPLVITLQTMDDSFCTTTPSEVVDERDDRIYTVQRLADGKCWMMENLSLGATAISVDLDPSNTNMTSGSVPAATFNGWKKSSGTATLYAGEYIVASGNDSYNSKPYGVLYNYCATSAKTICSYGNSDNATQDLCPAGWRLPSGGGVGEFSALYTAYGKTPAAMRDASGPALTTAGIFSSGGISSKGTSGQFWTYSYYSINAMYVAQIRSNSFTLVNSQGRDEGASIRCVHK